MLNLIQITLLLLVALAGIPAGFYIASCTREELKPGKKWFRIIMATSAIVMIASFAALTGDVQTLAITTSLFTYFLSAVPLYLMKKKR